jgi:N-acetylmuramoyl-L-alanine amidase
MTVATRSSTRRFMCLAALAFAFGHAGTASATRHHTTATTVHVHPHARKVAKRKQPDANNAAVMAPRRAVAARARSGQTATSSKHRTVVDEKPLIVIDPGHGGRDSGAIGHSGLYEKAVALETALTLRRQLLATGHYRVAMTRTTDVFVSLAHRVAFARSHHAALLISIHANASPDPRTHGASVFVRTPQANDDAITSVVGGPGASRGIANALDAKPHPNSTLLQTAIIDSLNDDVRMVESPARNAHLFVLAERDIPGVLVEMGFLSNQHDEALLKRPKYRLTIANAIRDAVDDYYAALQHPDALRT